MKILSEQQAFDRGFESYCEIGHNEGCIIWAFSAGKLLEVKADSEYSDHQNLCDEYELHDRHGIGPDAYQYSGRFDPVSNTLILGYAKGMSDSMFSRLVKRFDPETVLDFDGWVDDF